MQPVNHDLMRITNTLGILECIRQSGPVTKREIQERTGLSWGAVSNITSALLSKRMISECKSAESLIGRTPSTFDINETDNLIMGLDINIEGITAVLVDLKCRLLKMKKEGVVKNDRSSILLQLKQLVRSLIEASGVGKSAIVGLGVAMQGAVDIGRGISVFSPHFTDWKEVPVKDILEKEFEMPVMIDHDPNCMALSERWMGAAKGIDELLFIRLSMAVGMSMIIHGEVYRGVDGSAGEFGHMTMNPGGPRCSCGNYGCLEAYISGNSILQKAVEGMQLGRFSVAPQFLGDKRELGLEHVIAAARQGDGFAKGLFEEAGVYLGIGISNLINLLNPELIVIGGEMTKCADLYLDRAKEIMAQKVWKNSRVRLAVSNLESSSAAVGAAALFIQKIFAGEMTDILC